MMLIGYLLLGSYHQVTVGTKLKQKYHNRECSKSFCISSEQHNVSALNPSTGDFAREF